MKPNDDQRAPDLQHLKWLALLLPVAGVVVGEILRGIAIDPFVSDVALRHIIAGGVAITAVVVFAGFMFIGIERAQRRVIRQNRALRMTHDAYRDVREAILGLRESSRGDRHLMESLRAYCDKFSRQAGIETTLETTTDEELGLPLRGGDPGDPGHPGGAHQRPKARRRPPRHGARQARPGERDARRRRRWPRVRPRRRSSSTARTASASAGMRERMELVGGTLSVHSAPGRGTRITARVARPVLPTPRRIEEPRAERESHAQVLLVDDQPLFRSALATLIDGQPDLHGRRTGRERDPGARDGARSGAGRRDHGRRDAGHGRRDGGSADARAGPGDPGADAHGLGVRRPPVRRGPLRRARLPAQGPSAGVALRHDPPRDEGRDALVAGRRRQAAARRPRAADRLAVDAGPERPGPDPAGDRDPPAGRRRALATRRSAAASRSPRERSRTTSTTRSRSSSSRTGSRRRPSSSARAGGIGRTRADRRSACRPIPAPAVPRARPSTEPAETPVRA